VLGGQPQDPGDLLGVRGRDNRIGHASEYRRGVASVDGALAVGEPDMAGAGDGAQLSQDWLRDAGGSRHDQSSKQCGPDVVQTAGVIARSPSGRRKISRPGGGKSRFQELGQLPHCEKCCACDVPSLVSRIFAPQ
jgi:hypothetical protein